MSEEQEPMWEVSGNPPEIVKEKSRSKRKAAVVSSESSSITSDSSSDSSSEETSSEEEEEKRKKEKEKRRKEKEKRRKRREEEKKKKRRKKEKEQRRKKRLLKKRGNNEKEKAPAKRAKDVKKADSSTTTTKKKKKKKKNSLQSKFGGIDPKNISIEKAKNALRHHTTVGKYTGDDAVEGAELKTPAVLINWIPQFWFHELGSPKRDVKSVIKEALAMLNDENPSEDIPPKWYERRRATLWDIAGMDTLYDIPRLFVKYQIDPTSGEIHTKLLPLGLITSNFFLDVTIKECPIEDTLPQKVIKKWAESFKNYVEAKEKKGNAALICDAWPTYSTIVEKHTACIESGNTTGLLLAVKRRVPSTGDLKDYLIIPIEVAKLDVTFKKYPVIYNNRLKEQKVLAKVSADAVCSEDMLPTNSPIAVEYTSSDSEEVVEQQADAKRTVSRTASRSVDPPDPSIFSSSTGKEKMEIDDDDNDDDDTSPSITSSTAAAKSIYIPNGDLHPTSRGHQFGQKGAVHSIHQFESVFACGVRKNTDKTSRSFKGYLQKVNNLAEFSANVLEIAVITNSTSSPIYLMMGMMPLEFQNFLVDSLNNPHSKGENSKGNEVTLTLFTDDGTDPAFAGHNNPMHLYSFEGEFPSPPKVGDQEKIDDKEKKIPDPSRTSISSGNKWIKKIKTAKKASIIPDSSPKVTKIPQKAKEKEKKKKMTTGPELVSVILAKKSKGSKGQSSGEKMNKEQVLGYYQNLKKGAIQEDENLVSQENKDDKDERRAAMAIRIVEEKKAATAIRIVEEKRAAMAIRVTKVDEKRNKPKAAQKKEVGPVDRPSQSAKKTNRPANRTKPDYLLCGMMEVRNDYTLLSGVAEEFEKAKRGLIEEIISPSRSPSSGDYIFRRYQDKKSDTFNHAFFYLLGCQSSIAKEMQEKWENPTMICVQTIFVRGTVGLENILWKDGVVEDKYLNSSHVIVLTCLGEKNTVFLRTLNNKDPTEKPRHKILKSTTCLLLSKDRKVNVVGMKGSPIINMRTRKFDNRNDKYLVAMYFKVDGEKGKK